MSSLFDQVREPAAPTDWALAGTAVSAGIAKKARAFDRMKRFAMRPRLADEGKALLRLYG
jgi:hypothetical protein